MSPSCSNVASFSTNTWGQTNIVFVVCIAFLCRYSTVSGMLSNLNSIIHTTNKRCVQICKSNHPRNGKLICNVRYVWPYFPSPALRWIWRKHFYARTYPSTRIKSEKCTRTGQQKRTKVFHKYSNRYPGFRDAQTCGSQCNLKIVCLCMHYCGDTRASAAEGCVGTGVK